VDLVKNKPDLLEMTRLLTRAVAADEKTRCRFDEVFMVSARTGSGVQDLQVNIQEVFVQMVWFCQILFIMLVTIRGHRLEARNPVVNRSCLPLT